ncbi:MAG: ATP-binding protein, partial [Spirochaetaceae bacterium]
MEIKSFFTVSKKDLGLIEMHSALNLLNALLAEVYVFSDLLGLGVNETKTVEGDIVELAGRLRDPSAASLALKSLGDFSQALRARLMALKDQAFRRRTGGVEEQAIETQEENIDAVLEIFAVRASELLERRAPEAEWREFTIDLLRRSLQQVLDVMQRLTTTSPRIVYDPPEHTPDNHLFLFRSCRDDFDRILLPAVFQDVIRDLVANARKYTQPGGSYSVDLCENGSTISIVVTDDGRGIPPNEVARTVEFGYRATNAQDRRTLGGGFGLTKAYLTTQRHGGRFFIDSAPDAGTTIRIELPVSASRR